MRGIISLTLPTHAGSMGTYVACNCATVTYGHYEKTEILPYFKSNLLYYKRYIDNIFGIWLPHPPIKGSMEQAQRNIK
jgi:hypothetical protein